MCGYIMFVYVYLQYLDQLRKCPDIRSFSHMALKPTKQVAPKRVLRIRQSLRFDICLNSFISFHGPPLDRIKRRTNLN